MSDDSAMQRMGLSLAKGIKYPEDIQPLIVSLALFSTEKNIREEALECIKDIGIEKISMPTKSDWNEVISNYIRPQSGPTLGGYREGELKDIKPVIETLLSLESTKSLPHLKHIYNRATYKHGKLIVDGVAKFCDRKECVKFYDELIKTSLNRYFIIGDYSWDYGYSIDELNRKRVVLFFSAYVKINAQERHGFIFSITFNALVFAITHKATTEEKQKPVRGFIKEGMGLCFKLDKNSPSNSDRTLLLLKKHLFSNRGRNSREKKIAAAQIFEMLYKDRRTFNTRLISRKSRNRISEIVEPARKDRLTLVRTSLKSIK